MNDELFHNHSNGQCPDYSCSPVCKDLCLPVFFSLVSLKPISSALPEKYTIFSLFIVLISM